MICLDNILKHKNAYINAFKNGVVGGQNNVSYPNVDSTSPYYKEINEEQEVSNFAYEIGKVVRSNVQVGSGGSGGSSSGGTVNGNYAPLDHNHDNVYAKIVHNHDDRYYTKTYVDNWIDRIINGDLLYNKINAKHIQAGTIVAGSSIIANGAIGSAHISSVSADKIDAGIIDTSKIIVQGANGNLKLKGNRLQVFEGIGNSQFERVSLGDVNNDGTSYGLRVRGRDGQTVLYDENGVYREGITDGSITNDKIGDDANIDGGKLNIHSVINNINDNNTGTIHGTKVDIDGESVSSKVYNIILNQNEHSEIIERQQSEINQNREQINLKVSNQKYTEDMASMTSKLEKAESNIELLNDSIKLTASKTEVENQINNIKDFVSSEIGDISVGGANYLNNSAPRKATVDDLVTWDRTLNGTRRLTYWQDYNDSVETPQVGYHPHIDLETFHFPCIALINRNGKFNMANRELSLRHEIHKAEEVIVPNETYVISFDAYSDTSLFSFHGGLYHKNVESNNYNYHSGRMDITISQENVGIWQRYSFTFDIHKGINTSEPVYLVINGHNNPEGSGYIKNIKLERSNIVSQWTPSQFDIDDSLNDVVESSKDYTNQAIKNYSAVVDVKYDEINLRVDATETDINGVRGSVSEISQKADSLTTTVSGLNGKYTELKQAVDGFDLTGRVSFSDLSTSGKTVINGANITTGYISGDRIKGGTISATDEINFVGGARVFGNEGAYGAGLKISAQEYQFTSGKAYFESDVYAEKNLTVSGNITNTTGTLYGKRVELTNDAVIKGTTYFGTGTYYVTNAGALKVNSITTNSFNTTSSSIGTVTTNRIDVYGYSNLDGNMYVSGTGTIVGTLNVKNQAINGMGNITLAKGTIYLPQGGGNNNTDYLRIGGGYMAGVSSGNFHFITSGGATSSIYAKNVVVGYSLEPSLISDVSALDKISEINVVNTSEGFRLIAPVNRSLDESQIVTTSYNEKTNQEEIQVDFNSAISTLWKAIQELKEENTELKKLIKGVE